MSFKPIDSKMDLPKLEEEILEFWDKDRIFEKSLEQRKDAPAYTFYDGPPFATGSPHYGHIVASTIKDVVPRYWTMKGKSVERKWGWDCHGLPIENIAEKELGFTHKKEILELGVDKFNEICRSKVLGYVSEWEKVIRRLGRWADMKNSYKTMDLSYMESVWWVFKQLWNKGLVYEGYHSMHICPRCETTLSQSEVSEGYKTIKDLSAIAKFELVDEPSTYFLAWTTTPWTLIGNVALAVGSDIDYVKVETETEEGKIENYILAKNRLALVMKEKRYKILDNYKGRDLVGKAYEPLFDYYFKDAKLPNRENGWKVYSADFVSTEEGTGVVHIAPAFGENDLELGQKNNLPFVQHIGMDGVIKPEIEDFAGMHVKDIEDNQKTDIEIIKNLAHQGLLFFKEKYEHSYPHCWRCDTPLLNYATSSWFVAVTKIKEEAIDLSKNINWSPKHIKEGRFGKWLEGARDWSVSRQRFWASVIPIWRCSECDEITVFGSIGELEKMSGQKVSDLHKDTVDKITFACAKCKGSMKRIPDVLDTWFDSGSMPYAQLHYPFENKDKFEKGFPAEFIAEGVDQTRAWFYYLHVISSAINKNVAFKNVIVNGIVLAEDGKKMSKKLQNYPDPTLMFDKYGADVMRLYFLTSPVMQAENLNFKEADMAELSRGIFRMLWNSYSFFTLYANIDKWEPAGVISTHSEPATGQIEEGEKSHHPNGNLLDKWIISELNKLIDDVNNSMTNYDLTKTARLFAPFIDNLSNWYIRRSRKRFWKSENDSDKNNAYQTLWTVLIQLSRLMAPFTPFIADDIFRNLAYRQAGLTNKESVHLEDYPTADKKMIDAELNTEMEEARKIVELGLSCRAMNKIKVRQPLQLLTYHGKELPRELLDIIAEEVNVKEIKRTEGDPNLVELDLIITKQLKLEGLAREIIRNIQTLRKDTGFNVDDRILVYYQTDSKELNDAISIQKDLITKEVLANSVYSKREKVEGESEYSIDNIKIWIGISKAV